MDEKLFALPWHLQLALGSGYLAYLVAYAGIRQHHTATDTVFRSIAFGLVASAILLWLPAVGLRPHWIPPAPIWRPLAAVIATVAVGAFWRWRGMRWSRSMLEAANVSWSDDIPSAWISITAQRTDVRPSQVTVDLNDGRTLVCDDTRMFRDSPFGPCVFGLDGSVALYVTAERRADDGDTKGEWFEHDDVRNPMDGDRLTYIPASAIRRVELRHWTKANAKGAKAAEPARDAVAAPAAFVAEPSPECKLAPEPFTGLAGTAA